MGLQNSALLVKLTIRCWDGFKKDKRVSERVDAEFQTAGGAGNYNKRLIAKGILAPITSVVTRIRADHAHMTMPWQYDGVSLLPNKLFFDYKRTMDRNIDEFNSQVDNFIRQYPIHKANQAKALNTLFNPDEYPEADKLRAKFGVTLALFPVPQAEHFLIELEEHDIAALKAEFSKNMANTNIMVKAALYERVIELVQHAYDRLHDPGNIFRNTMTENLAQLAAVLPSLNVFDDPVLAIASERITTDILIAHPDRLREDVGLREKATNGAFDLLTLLNENFDKLKKGQ